MIASILDNFPYWDIGLAVIWLLILNLHWISYVPPAVAVSVEERALGFISSQLSAVITGTSVILAGLGAFIALKSGATSFPLRYSLFLSALWAVLALAISLYAYGVLPHYAPRTNVVRVKGVAMLCSGALFQLSCRMPFCVGCVWIATAALVAVDLDRAIIALANFRSSRQSG